MHINKYLEGPETTQVRWRYASYFAALFLAMICMYFCCCYVSCGVDVVRVRTFNKADRLNVEF